MNVPKLSKEQMFVILGAFAVVGILAWLKVELTAFLAFAGLILVGVGVIQQSNTKAEVAEVKTQTNGNNQRLIDALLTDKARNDAALLQALAYMPPEHAPRIAEWLASGAAQAAAERAVPAPRESAENVALTP
jgi:hypothetical protein